MEKIILQQQGKWLTADTQTPISLYLSLVGRKPGILLESSEVDGRLGRYSLIAWDFKLTLACRKGLLAVDTEDERFKSLQDLQGQNFLSGLRQALDLIHIKPPKDIALLPAMTRSVCGFFEYGMAGLFEPALADVLPPDKAGTHLVLPEQLILFDHLHSRCCYLTLGESCDPKIRKMPGKRQQPEIGDIQCFPEQKKYEENVLQVKELIRQGEAIQVVISTRFQSKFTGDRFTLYRRLRQINPSPYTFYMHFGTQTVMGSSPELMVRCDKDRVEVRPIAGTRPRGKNEAEDIELAQDLLADPKERAEHVMLVDLGRNDLGRIAGPGSVQVDKYMQVENFSHVMHLTSYLSAKLKPETDALDVLAATFPAGTLSGAPKIRAMQIIADMEDTERGPYGGAIGWIGLDKSGVYLDTGITIRSLWIRQGKIHWQAGAGIVFDSDPEKEWQECNNKARAIRSAINNQESGDDFNDRQL